MITDIGMAFVAALFLEMYSIVHQSFKQIGIFVLSLTITIIYFAKGCQLNFIGSIDFGIWLCFAIMFDQLLMLGKKYILFITKEKK